MRAIFAELSLLFLQYTAMSYYIQDHQDDRPVAIEPHVMYTEWEKCWETSAKFTAN